MKDLIIYDQPLNEVMRVCLRLEQLFQAIDHHLSDTSTIGTKTVINEIIEVLHILDRPDLKAKLAKEMAQIHGNLSRYSKRPETNLQELQDLTQSLEELSHALIDSSGKIGQRLRNSDLLNTIKLHLASPGGGCCFDLPLYHYWLEQPAAIRLATIEEWLADFSSIKAIVALLLDIIRHHGKTEQKIAIHGFHQELLDPQSNLRMIRISLASTIQAYPEISIGRHFLSVRLYHSSSIEQRPQQHSENLPFILSYCYV